MRIKGTDKQAVKGLLARAADLRDYARLYPDVAERIAQLFSAAAEAFEAAGVEVSLRPAETSEAAAARLCSAYDLTAAEAKVALHVAAGGALADFAKTSGISRHTVRNQLRAVFQKTGVRRQAELVRLLSE